MSPTNPCQMFIRDPTYVYINDFDDNYSTKIVYLVVARTQEANGDHLFYYIKCITKGWGDRGIFYNYVSFMHCICCSEKLLSYKNVKCRMAFSIVDSDDCLVNCIM